VNAAGLTNRGTIEDTTVELWDLLLNVNARAPFILIQDVVLSMKAKKIHGSIVNIISDCAHGGYPFLMPYSVSKGALATLTKNVAHALRHERIRVNGISIGWMYTPHEHQIQLESGQPENWLELVEKDKPFQRLLRPRDVAYLTTYLLSDRSEMMTGSVIDFDQKVVGCLE
jgi:NAD(P)-dependent dehydrogenase (short-subunit alcohol dehydrogenase family)